MVPVRIGFDDDSGVQNVSLYDGARYVGSALPAENCQKVGEVEINWPTAGQSLGNHLLESLGLDWGGHIGRDSEIIAIRPQHCFDEELQEGEEEKGPPACGGECGACANGACEKNSDCASGFCENGRCLDKIKILGFGQKSGAPNTFVTIYGYYFGDQAGRVYFTATDKPQPDVNNDADWI